MVNFNLIITETMGSWSYYFFAVGGLMMGTGDATTAMFSSFFGAFLASMLHADFNPAVSFTRGLVGVLSPSSDDKFAELINACFRLCGQCLGMLAGGFTLFIMTNDVHHSNYAINVIRDDDTTSDWKDINVILFQMFICGGLVSAIRSNDYVQDNRQIGHGLVYAGFAYLSFNFTGVGGNFGRGLCSLFMASFTDNPNYDADQAWEDYFFLLIGDAAGVGFAFVMEMFISPIVRAADREGEKEHKERRASQTNVLASEEDGVMAE